MTDKIYIIAHNYIARAFRYRRDMMFKYVDAMRMYMCRLFEVKGFYVSCANRQSKQNLFLTAVCLFGRNSCHVSIVLIEYEHDGYILVRRIQKFRLDYQS